MSDQRRRTAGILSLLAAVALAGTYVSGVTPEATVTPQAIQQDPSLDTFRYELIDVPAGTSTIARGINNVGHVVGSYVDARGTHGFVLKEGTFATIDVPDSAWTIATGINNAGQIVGAYGTGAETSNRGFLLDQGRLTSLDAPDSLDTVANGINNAGDVVGSYFGRDGVRHGFLLRGRAYSSIDVTGARFTIAEGINDLGDVVGVSGNGVTTVGFSLSDRSFSTVQPPASAGSHARAVNNLGDIVGRESVPGAAAAPFLMRRNAFPAINAPGYPASWTAHGINDLRQIVGELTNDSGTHGYVATPRVATSLRTTDTSLPDMNAVAREGSPAADERERTRLVDTTATPAVPVTFLETTGEVRWVTVIGSAAAATFTTRLVGNGSSGEIRVSNHDGVSFTGTIKCYHQHSPTDAWFSGTIDTAEGRNVRGNRQGASTFVMSVRDGGPNGGNDRVSLTRGATPFECGDFHDAQRTVTAGNLVIRQR